jgi:drug/metabolite transporter (DMT)-like permease
VTAAVTLLVICLALRTPLVGFPAQSWWAMIGLALVTQVVGHLSVAYSLGRLPVSVTSVALLGQAPITAVLAVPLLGEGLSALQMLGGLLVLAGIYVVNRTPRRTPVAVAEPYIE